MNNINVSIIIPTHKPGFYFEDCIKSVSEQTYSKALYEVIIILNGDQSYDSYVKSILNKYLNSVHFTYLTTDIAGVSNARNMGIDKTAGEYIIFIDDDDVISPRFIELIVQVSSQTCIGVSCSKTFNTDINTAKVESFIVKKEKAFKKSFSLYRYRKCLSAPWGKCIPKNIIGEYRFNINFSLGEDNLFWLSFSHKIKNMNLANDNCLYYIRNRTNSLSRSKYKKRYLFIITLKRNFEMIRIFFKNPFKNNIPLFLAKLLSSTRGGIRMMKNS